MDQQRQRETRHKKGFSGFRGCNVFIHDGHRRRIRRLHSRAPSGGSTTYPDTVHGSLYVGPYQISVNGAPSIPMICDDYATEIGQGSTWTANAYTFGQLSQMKFFGNSSFGNGALNATQAYEEVFYLSAQMMHQPSTNYAAIAYAIWQIMDPKDNPAAKGPLPAPHGSPRRQFPITGRT